MSSMKQSKLKNNLGKRITLHGTAKNAKGYAVLITKDRNVIYIKELPEWSSQLLNTNIIVEGKLEKMKLIPDPKIEENGAISQGARGLQYVLLDYKLVKP